MCIIGRGLDTPFHRDESCRFALLCPSCLLQGNHHPLSGDSPVKPIPFYIHAELPTRLKSSDLPLHHFDRFFRATGALLVLGLLGIRALTAVLFPGLYPGSQLLAPGLIYSLQLLLRWGLYYLHLSGE